MRETAVRSAVLFGNNACERCGGGLGAVVFYQVDRMRNLSAQGAHNGGRQPVLSGQASQWAHTFILVAGHKDQAARWASYDVIAVISSPLPLRFPRDKQQQEPERRNTEGGENGRL